jgi:multidrug efflux pump subunit AcrB
MNTRRRAGWHLRGLGGVVPAPPLVTMLAATVFFVGSFMLVPLLPKGFLPPDDLSQTQIYLTLPPGVTFKDSLPRPSRRAPLPRPIRT